VALSEGNLFFENANNANKFSNWFTKFFKEFCSLPIREREQVWLGKEDFFREFDEGKPVCCEAVIPFKFDPQTDNLQIDIWIWVKSFCEGKVWRYDNKFYFEKNVDAIAFKLTWVGDL
jgi:hypothetical protein